MGQRDLTAPPPRVGVRASHGRIRPAAVPGLAALLDREPFAAKVRLRHLTVTGAGVFDFAVAVPVRNERALLPAMLAALLPAMRGTDRAGTIVFVVNDSDDGSAAIIAHWLALNALAGAVLDVRFAPAIRNAPHARRLALDVAALFVADGALLTTDADSEVGPRWVAERLLSLAGGVDLVCEDVRLDEAGLAALPDRVRLIGEAEREYYAACDRLWTRWSGGTAGAFAHRASGASMALRSPVYRALGDWPVPAHGEDGLLCRLIVERGGSVVTIADGGTRTSARLAGRAAGGCGAALGIRAADPDPECDGALVPVAELRRLAAHRLRHGVRDEGARAKPLRFSELRRELALARDLLSTEEPA